MEWQERDKKLRRILDGLLEELQQRGCSADELFKVHLCIESAILSVEGKDAIDNEE